MSRGGSLSCVRPSVRFLPVLRKTATTYSSIGSSDATELADMMRLLVQLNVRFICDAYFSGANLILNGFARFLFLRLHIIPEYPRRLRGRGLCFRVYISVCVCEQNITTHFTR